MQNYPNKNQDKSLLPIITLLALPIGLLFAWLQTLLYFVGLIACFIATLLQSPTYDPTKTDEDLANQQKKLRWTMLIILLYIVGGILSFILF